jgi:hypothetical protein
MSNKFDYDDDSIFDPKDIVETMISNQVEVRTSRFIANFCISVTFVLLFIVALGGSLLIINLGQEKTVIIQKQPN